MTSLPQVLPGRWEPRVPLLGLCGGDAGTDAHVGDGAGCWAGCGEVSRLEMRLGESGGLWGDVLVGGGAGPGSGVAHVLVSWLMWSVFVFRSITCSPIFPKETIPPQLTSLTHVLIHVSLKVQLFTATA